MDWWSIALNVASLLVLVFQGLLAWALWSLRKQFVSSTHCGEQCKAAAEKHATLELEQAKLKQEQARLEQAQKALPDADEVQAMAVQLAEIEGSIKAVMATVQGQAELMQRIERPLNLLLEHHVRGPK
jgi:uncharacterized protein (DUF3084 family)